jgi:hypothetical protein
MDNNPFMFEEEQRSEPQANPFMFDEAPAQKQPSEEPGLFNNSFMAGVEGLNRQFGRMAEGILDLVTPGDAIKQTHDRNEAAFAQTKEAHPVAARAGELIGGPAASVAFGALGAGAAMAAAPAAASSAATYAAAHPLAAGTLASAAGGAGQGYLDYADTQGERLGKAAIGGAIGAVAGPVAYGLGKLGRRWFKPKEAALDKLTQEVRADLGDNAAEKIPGLLRPAATLGDTRTPGQAIGGLTASKEAQFSGSPAVQATARTIERQQSERTLQGVSDAIEKIAPAGTKETREALYKELAGAKLPDEAVSSFKTNGVLAKELDGLNLGTEVTEATKALPDNSVAKWNIVKQEVDDKLFRDARALDPTNKKGLEAVRALREARQKIVDTIDPAFPSYAAARKESQKLILRKRYDDLLMKKGAKAGKAGELDVDETFQTLFPNKETQKVFIQDITEAGGDAKQAEDIITALEQLRGNPLKKIWSRPAEDSGVATFYGNKVGFVQKIEDVLSGGRYKKALLELTFNGNEWAPQVVKALNSPNKHESMLKLMLKVTGKGAVRSGSTELGRGMLQK